MTVTRNRMLSIGLLVWVDVVWDSPLQDTLDDGTVVNGDPNASWLISQVWGQNLSSPAETYEVVFRYRNKPWDSALLPPNSPEFLARSWSGNQRPDMRDLSAFTLMRVEV